MTSTAAQQQHLRAVGVEPATLKLADAAAYVSLSPNTFLREVAAGTMPPPVPLASRRKLWSRAALDARVGGRKAAPDPIERQIDEAIERYAG